jgi:serine/threonine protein kinase
MLYSMITGFRPFQGNSAETVCFKVINVEPVPVTSFQTEVHPGLDRIVSRAIAKDPDERYQSGAELARDIRDFLTSNNIPIETNSPLPAWATQTTRQLGLHPSEEYFKQFFWRAVVAVVAVAALLTGWQVKKEMRENAEIEPPPARVQSAPAIQKTPVVVRRRQPLLSRVKKVEQPPPLQTARIHVEILHHFAGGKASILLDNQVVLDENLRADTARHPILRSLEMDQTANIDVSSGKHQVQVHVVSVDNTYDQTETVEADLAPASRHVLHVNCDRRQMLVTLQPAFSSTPAKQ